MKAPRNEREAHSALMRTQPIPAGPEQIDNEDRVLGIAANITAISAVALAAWTVYMFAFA